MKIGELASRTALNASAIRYYERCGLLAAPYRVSGQRRYSDDDVHRVLLIRFASDMGFTLGEIKLFLSGLRDKAPVGPRWRKLAHHKIKEVNEIIQRSRRLKSPSEIARANSHSKSRTWTTRLPESRLSSAVWKPSSPPINNGSRRFPRMNPR